MLIRQLKLFMSKAIIEYKKQNRDVHSSVNLFFYFMNINLKEMPKKIGSSFSQKTEKNRTNYHKKKLMPFIASFFLVIIFVAFPVHEAKAFDLVGVVWDGLMEVLVGGISMIIYNVMNLALFITVGIVHFGAYLIDIMVNPVLYRTVFASAAVTAGWTTIRDFCNMFFIFFLLVIAFATILRISAYSAKAILPKFLIAIFMINFSQEITKMVIDFGQVFMYEFISWMGGSFSGPSGGGNGLTSIADYYYNYYHAGLLPDFDAVLSISFAVAYTFALGFIYIILSGFLLVRLLAFVVLIIFSPFAIFAMVFPGTRKYTTEWWSGLIKYTMFGPVFMFFVYLSSVMASSLQGKNTPLALSIEAGAGYAGTGLGFQEVLTTLIPNVISLGMLLAAIPMSQKLGSIAGSSTLIGGGLGGLGSAVMGSYAGAKLAGGWGKKVAGGVDNRVLGGRASEWGKKQKEKVLLGLPGGIGRGTVLKDRARDEKKKDKDMKEIRVEFGEAKNRDLDQYQKKANSALATKEDKVLFAETAAAQGKLGDSKYAGDIKKFMPEIEKTLSKKDLEEGITNKNLSLATETSESKARIKNLDTTGMDDKDKIKFAGASNNQKEEMVKEQIMKEKMADLIRDGKVHEVQGLDNGMAAKVWHESQTLEQRKSNTTRMAKDQKGLLQKGYMANTTDAPADMEKDIEFRTNAVKMGADLEESFKRGLNIIESDIAEAFSEFSSKEIIKFTPEQLEKYGNNVNASQVRALNREGEQKKVGYIRESKKAKLTEVETDLAGLKAGPARDVLEEEEKQLNKAIKHIEDMLTGDKY